MTDGVAMLYLTTNPASGVQASSVNTVVSVLNPDSGAIKSTCNSPLVTKSAVGANGNLYLLATPSGQSSRASWIQVNPKTCESLWPSGYQASTEQMDSTLWVGPTIAATTEGDKVVALDVKTGALAWTSPTQMTATTLLANTGKSVTVELAGGAGVDFLDPATGKVLNAVTPAKGEEAIADPVSGVTYIGSGSTLSAYDATGATALWTQANVDSTLHFTIACSDRVWLHRGTGPDLDGLNVVLDGKTGKAIAENVRAPSLCLDSNTGWFESGAKPLPALS